MGVRITSTMGVTERLAVKITSTIGVIEVPAKVRITSITGVTQLLKRVRVTSTMGTTALRKSVRVTAAFGRVALDPNAPQLFVTRSAVTVPAACPLILTATAIPVSPATITAWTWRVLNKDAGMPAAILGGSSMAIAVFRGRPTLRGGKYAIGVQAVDSLGRRSVEVPIVVTVEAAGMFSATTAGTWVPSTVEWTGEQVRLDPGN